MKPHDRSRILHWVHTGEHAFNEVYSFNDKIQEFHDCPNLEPVDNASATPSESGTPSSGTPSKSDTLSSETPSELRILQYSDNDPLLPRANDAQMVYGIGSATWSVLFETAAAMPSASWPRRLSNPAILLKDVPALPIKLPRSGSLYGTPEWRIPVVEEVCSQLASPGLLKQVDIGLKPPTQCRLSICEEDGKTVAFECSAILTLCWSYIISVRFLELQRRRVYFTRAPLPSSQQRALDSGPEDVVVDLGSSASSDLIAWLCAILAPGQQPGWGVHQNPRYPPWAAFFHHGHHRRFVIAGNAKFVPVKRPPTSAEATELLVEFCGLYGIHSNEPQGSCEVISPVTAAFYAALTFPSCYSLGQKPEFPTPRTKDRISCSPTKFSFIRDYTKDLRYYMTISIQPSSVGSIIWSIFWQPDIYCNHVSPWLASVLKTIMPLLQSEHKFTLVKLFALRRPRVTPWWLGLMLLGDDVAIFDRIHSYLCTLQERANFPCLSTPDTTVAAWTGSAQSYSDDSVPTDVHTESQSSESRIISRADQLRHRYLFLRQDPGWTYSAWRPFGSVLMKNVESELWPQLELEYSLEYVDWIWWTKDGNDVQKGYRHDVGTYVDDVTDDLLLCATCLGDEEVDFRRKPSKTATLNMLINSKREANGDRDMTLINTLRSQRHSWLKRWFGWQ